MDSLSRTESQMKCLARDSALVAAELASLDSCLDNPAVMHEYEYWTGRLKSLSAAMSAAAPALMNDYARAASEDR